MGFQGLINCDYSLTVFGENKTYTRTRFLRIHASMLMSPPPSSAPPRRGDMPEMGYTEESTHHIFAQWDTLPSQASLGNNGIYLRCSAASSAVTFYTFTAT